jgi:hypothetical protein
VERIRSQIGRIGDIRKGEGSCFPLVEWVAYIVILLPAMGSWVQGG